MERDRWTRRCVLTGLALLVVAALCSVSAGLGTPPASADASVSVSAHLGGVVRAVYAAEGYLLWGQGAELQVYSEDGTTRLGRLLLPALISDIDVDANTAYVAARDGLYLISLANLAQPAVVRHIPAPPLEELSMVSAVAVAGGHAFVGLADAGLWVADLSAATNQSAPPAGAALVLAPDHHYISELYQSGSFLFSVDNFSGSPGQPRVWDISDPATPVDLGRVNAAADASGVAVAGGHLFVSTFFHGLSIYAWNPTQPLTATLVGSVPVGGGGYEVALSANGQQALVASEGSLSLVDVANRAAPVVRDTETAPFGYFTRLAVNGNRAMGGLGEAAVMIYGFDTTSLTFERGLGLHGAAMAGARLGEQVFVANNSAGLLRLAAADPAHPAVTGSAPIGSLAQAVATNGTHVLVGAGDQVVVFDPASLAEIGRMTLPDFHPVNGLAASGNTGFAAAGHAGVCSLELSGGVPKLRTCLDTDGEVTGVALDGTRLYAADSGNGVVVVDVTDPQNPQPLGRYADAFALDVAVAGGQLFVSDYNNGNGRLLMLDRGAGAALTFAAAYDTRGFVADVEVAGNLVYAANQEGLEVLKRASATELAAWAWYDSAGGANEVVLVGDQVYLMDGANGLLVLQLSATDPPPTTEPGGGPFVVRLPMVFR